MRQKWVVIAVIGVLASALFGNQLLSARLSPAESAIMVTDAGNGQAGSAEVGQVAQTENDLKTAASTPRVLEHVVSAGETLSSIAGRYNTDTASLKAANGIVNDRALQIGQKLVVLTVPGVLHKIASGDTLWDLARAYGVSLDTIYQANPGLQNSALQLGQRLIVPGAKPIVQRQAVASRGTSGSRSGSSSSKTSAIFSWPLSGRITSSFGQRWGKLHAAIDIGVATGTLVKAAAAGTVTYAGWANGYGYLVKIKHSSGYETRYGHNSAVLVKAGQQVARGATIARSGSTGNSTGPHLHFEVRKYGTAINPMTVLP